MYTFYFPGVDDGSRMHSMKYFTWRLEVGNPAERSEGYNPELVEWVDNDFYFEPHLALFMKLQEAYPEYKEQFVYA